MLWDCPESFYKLVDKSVDDDLSPTVLVLVRAILNGAESVVELG